MNINCLTQMVLIEFSQYFWIPSIYMFQDLTSLVVDLGSAFTRIGYGGDDAPRLMPHSYISHFQTAMSNEGESNYQIGDQSLWNQRSDNVISSIYSHKGSEGYQFDFESLEQFLSYHLTHELGVNLKDYSVLLSEDLAAKASENRQFRQKIAEFLFQRLGVANVFYLKAPVLSCFATGRSTALVVDSGENFTRTVAVHQGFCLQKSTRVIPYGGHHLSKDIERNLRSKLGEAPKNKYALSGKDYSPSFLHFHQQQLLGDIKASLSVRRQQQSGTESLLPTIEYELPDNNRIVVVDRKQIKNGLIDGDQAFSFKGAASLVSQTVNSCDVDIKKELYSNILLTGGNVLYGSMVEDLLSRIGDNAPANVKVKSVSVCANAERRYLAWIGGSIVTSLSSFQSYWVGAQEWKQCGPAILQRKCT